VDNSVMELFPCQIELRVRFILRPDDKEAFIPCPAILQLPVRIYIFMRFKVEDVVHNTTTKEQGRIVRIADTSLLGRVAYIVSIELHPSWSITAKEALWPQTEIEKGSP
jgi:hypothetical protein